MKGALTRTISVMGVWMGLAGVEHGIGEVLQGEILSGGGMIYSWPDAPFFASLNGEPAFTLLPGILSTGILALVTSLVFIAWCIFRAGHRHAGLGMMAAAVPMFLFGAGIFPPILGFLLGLAVVLLRAGQMRPVTSPVEKLAGRGWKILFTACILAWLALLPGMPLLAYFAGLDDAGLIYTMILTAILLLGLTFWSAALRDRMEGESSLQPG